METGIDYGSDAPPKPDNENRRLFSADTTLEECMQWIRREKMRLAREVNADPRLMTCPEHQLTWRITLAMERCALWHYYGVR